MPGFDVIQGACRSIARLLNLSFKQHDPHPGSGTRAILVRTEDLEGDGTGVLTRPAISIFLYRVDYHRPMRAAWSSVGHQEGRAYLPLELHLLLTPWAENAEYEYRILGRAMQCLETDPILSGPLLDAETSWATGDAIQVTLGELSNEEIMRIFDSLPVDYKLSVPYVARTIRIDDETRAAPPVIEVHQGLGPVPAGGQGARARTR